MDPERTAGEDEGQSREGLKCVKEAQRENELEEDLLPTRVPSPP